MSFETHTVTELQNGYAAGDFSVVDVVESCIRRIEEQDQSIQSFVTVTGDSALSAAKEIDDRRRQGAPLGPLAGIPIAVKDLLCTKGQRTACGSRMLQNYVPPFDATVVERLKQADAILIGKTNLDEFAMGSSTEHSAEQLTRNPWDQERIPGGSSGGSAACVAARMTPLSLGTDTGGSIRQPASLCGVVGLKPTYGRVSRFGLVAFASSLDQIGPFATTASDAEALFQVIAGADSRDSTCSPRDVDPAIALANEGNDPSKPLHGIKLGRIREHFEDGLQPEIGAAIDVACREFEKLGATIVDVSLPNQQYGVSTYYVIAPCEASSNLARYDGAHYGFRAENCDNLNDMYCESRSQGFGREVKRRIMLGTYALSEGYYDAFYLKALKVRRLIRNDYEAAFRKVDLLLGPTTPTTAFQIGEKADDPLAMYLADIYTVPANLAGVPAMSLPCGFDQAGLPIGMQLQANAFQESKLLGVAKAFQSSTDWHQRRPQ